MTVSVMTVELTTSSECVEMTVSVMTVELTASSECVVMTVSVVDSRTNNI